MKEITLSVSGNKDAQSKKQAQKLRKKLKKIEQLKKKREVLLSQIEKYKKTYKDEVYPREKNYYKIIEDFIEMLLSKFKQKSFSQKHRDMIEEIMVQEAGNLQSRGYHSENFQKLMTAYEEVQIDRLSKEEDEMINDFMNGMMEDMDFEEVDEGDDEYDEDIDTFFEQLEEEEHKKAQEEYTQFQDVQKADKVLNTDKDFAKIYKALAKKIHPDLATDPEEKNQREQWMKRLSALWNERNYIELLHLKNEVQGGKDHSYDLAQSQYKSIIVQVDAEIRTLEAEEYRMKHHDHDTAFYYRNFHCHTKKALDKKVKRYLKVVDEDITDVRSFIQQCKTQASTRNFLNERFLDVDPFDLDMFW